METRGRTAQKAFVRDRGQAVCPGRVLVGEGSRPLFDQGTENSAMTCSTPTEKQQLRREKLQARKSLTPEYRRTADMSIRNRLEALEEYRRASVVAAYASDDPSRGISRRIPIPATGGRWPHPLKGYMRSVSDIS